MLRAMNGNEMERVNQWNHPATLGRTNHHSGGTLSPRAGRTFAPPATGSDRKRWDQWQGPDRIAQSVALIP